MIRKLVFALPFLACSLGSFAAPASGRPDIAVEYEQVRRIALRDLKVQKAFEKANRQLQEKIVELDPALADYRPSKQVEAPRETRVAHPEPFRPAPVARTRPKANPAPRVSAPVRKNHTLEKGETLGSVAGKYHVSVQELRGANRIRDDRKLSVGQVLIIPAAKH